MNTYEQQVAQKEPTAFEWFQEFNGFWVAGILPIVLAYIGYKSLKAKVDAINKKKQEETGGYEVGDETIMRYIAKKLKKENG